MSPLTQWILIMRILCAMSLLFFSALACALEEPEYRVLDWPGAAPNKGIELREYAPHLVAETSAVGDFKASRNRAFRRLFRYISGENMTQTDIAMTAPVTTAAEGVDIAMTAPVTTAASSDGHWMQFALPKKYNERTAPQPSDPNVRLRLKPAERLAAIRYSGSSGERNAQRHERELMQALAVAGLKPVGKARLAVYNGPFTLWPFRRNEVMVVVEAQ
jgi:hypothetical protein